MVKRLGKRGNFLLRGESRKDKFVNTIKSFTKGGACTFVYSAPALIGPLDCFTGRGIVSEDGEKSKSRDKGFEGYLG